MTVVVATTLAAYVMDQDKTWASWLRNAEEMLQETPRAVQFFAALQTDQRGLDPFEPLLTRMEGINQWAAAVVQAGHPTAVLPATESWAYSLDDGRTEVTTANRLRHITCGQNLCSDYATAVGASHMLFMAADCEPPVDAIPRLLEVDWPIVGGHVSTYCLDGPAAGHRPGCPSWIAPAAVAACTCQWPTMALRAHMPTAAFVLLRRDVFKQLKWRWDADEHLADDPALYRDARALLGLDPAAVVRHDVVGRHFPESVPAIEDRGHDRSVHR